MIRYEVRLTDGATRAIVAQARYIATKASSPINAARWLQRVQQSVESLERWPLRAATAEENDHCGYEVRQLTVGSHLLLFTVDEDHQTVWIIGLRHGHRLPRPSDLPGGA